MTDRSVVPSLSAWILALVLFGGGAALAGDGKEKPQSPLIVHEWGTFTSFAGTDGVNLEFRPLVTNDLPGFVYFPNKLAVFGKKTYIARQRMETPVTYFYSDVEREVNVSVAFRQGRLTEFYPPPVSHETKLASDNKTVVEERVDWGKVHILPNRSMTTSVVNPEVAERVNRHVAMGLVPWMDGINSYYRARETDSSLLYVRRHPESPHLSSAASIDFKGDHFEKFLFYRGLGQIDLPLKAVALNDDRVHVENRTPQEIRGGLVVHYEGRRLRFAPIGPVAGGAQIETPLPAWPSVEMTDQFGALDQELTKLLVAEGLYEKEAASMVNTWRDSWYREPGLRVFFFVPQSQTDEVLPLTIEPKPDQVVRVLVARTELMTPSEERQLVSLLERTMKDSSAIKELIRSLSARGRLAEPALRRAAAIGKVTNVNELLDQVLPQIAAKG
ncbi:MAG TPA: hypothetical protein VM452_00195 [Caulifigura sp.]|jgi:hypothetical protein|nr:hypothetical protein [Caulifigura sp.]